MSEQDSSFYQTLTMVLGGLLVFFIIIIVAAVYIAGDDKSEVSVDPRIQAKVAKLIAPVGQLNTTVGAEVASAAPAAGAVDGKATYQSACFACHGTGAAGAPKFGDKAAWAPRIKQGTAILHKVALTGKGAMPPKGGNAGLSDAAVKAAVDYMVSQSK